MQVSKQGQLGLNVSSGFGVNVIFSVLLLYVLHFVVFRIGALLQEWTPHPKLPSPRPARIRQDRTRKNALALICFHPVFFLFFCILLHVVHVHFVDGSLVCAICSV